MQEQFMKEAYLLAQKAYKKNEVPIGAVIVKDNKIISTGFNTRNKSQIATNHAEVVAINKACKKLKSWRLEDCDIYVTLEPCPMCLGAILNARIKNLYFGAQDIAGSEDLLNKILNDTRLNHKCNCVSGIMQNECSALLSKFFKNKRNKNF